MDKALKEVMKIDFQELNAEYMNNQFSRSIEIVKESSREFGETLSNYSKKVISAAQLSIVNIIKESLSNLKPPSINSDMFNYKYTKTTITTIKGFKLLKNKKYIKKKN